MLEYGPRDFQMFLYNNYKLNLLWKVHLPESDNSIQIGSLTAIVRIPLHKSFETLLPKALCDYFSDVKKDLDFISKKEKKANLLLLMLPSTSLTTSQSSDFHEWEGLSFPVLPLISYMHSAKFERLRVGWFQNTVYYIHQS